MARAKPSTPAFPRCNRDDATALRDAATWILKLNGTDDPEGQDELRAEVARAEEAIARIRATIPATPNT